MGRVFGVATGGDGDDGRDGDGSWDNFGCIVVDRNVGSVAERDRVMGVDGPQWSRRGIQGVEESGTSRWFDHIQFGYYTRYT